jgi:hypothetical protein
VVDRRGDQESGTAVAQVEEETEKEPETTATDSPNF